MKLLNSQQIRELDTATMARASIKSIDLMERAARECTTWILKNLKGEKFLIVCGTGNNGGDGMAIARQLAEAGKDCRVQVLDRLREGTPDFRTNFERLKLAPVNSFSIIETTEDFPTPDEDTVIIDALFGTGISRPVDGLAAAVIHRINKLPNFIVSIDLPSGLPADFDAKWEGPNVLADCTLTFHLPKTSFLFEKTGNSTGRTVVLEIGLSRGVHEGMNSDWILTDAGSVCHLLLRERPFAHKGSAGSAALVVGSTQMPGAGVLASLGALYSGVGLVHVFGDYRVHFPPEIIHHSEAFNPQEQPKCTALCVGPGITTTPESVYKLDQLLDQKALPLVLDADALNILGEQNWLHRLPAMSVLTPHPGEFDRLFGPSQNDVDRLQLLRKNATETGCIILLKGAYTRIATPDGRLWFNGSGNAGMAKGGMGDVLSGLITGLIARGLSPLDAALAGTFIHGLAGDLVREKSGPEGVTAGALAAALSDAFELTRGHRGG